MIYIPGKMLERDLMIILLKENILNTENTNTLESTDGAMNAGEATGSITTVTREKNACKLTLNESLAKGMGFDVELYKQDQQDTGLNDFLVKLGADKLERQDYFTATKKKNEIKFENNSKEQLSSILVMILQNWKQHIYYLNQEENRYLAELRDALLPELMNGKIDLTEL